MGFMSQPTLESLNLKLNLGLIPKESPLVLDGKSNKISGTERQVWNGLPDIEFITQTAVSIRIFGSADEDIAGGVGAQQLTVIGIDANDDQIFQVADFLGGGTVVLPISLKKINVMFVSRTGSGNKNFGDIEAHENGMEPRTMSFINAEEGISQTSSFLIPKNHSLHIQRIIETTPKSQDINSVLFIQDANLTQFRLDTFLFENTTSSELSESVFPEKTRIMMRATSSQGQNNNLSSRIFGKLVRNK